MNISSVTFKRFKVYHLSNAPMVLYAWGASAVTLEAKGKDRWYHITLSEEEIRAALKKIEDRKAEIEQIVKRETLK